LFEANGRGLNDKRKKIKKAVNKEWKI